MSIFSRIKSVVHYIFSSPTEINTVKSVKQHKRKTKQQRRTQKQEKIKQKRLIKETQKIQKRNKVKTDVSTAKEIPFNGGTKTISQANIMVERLSEYIDGFPEPLKNMLKSRFDLIRGTVGDEGLAEGLLQHEEEWNRMLERIKYDSKGAVEEYNSALVEMIPSEYFVNEQTKRDLYDAMEFAQGYEEIE